MTKILAIPIKKTRTFPISAVSEKVAAGVPLMSRPNETKVEQLRGLFEGREAIYVEKSALRLKVSGIRVDVARQSVAAEVEEIPTTGLPVGAFHGIKQHELSPLR